MLTRPRLLFAPILAAAMVWSVVGVAHAAGGGGCDTSTQPWCSTNGSGSGASPGSGNSGGGVGGCSWNGQPIPCTDPDYGTYIGNGCYFAPYSPQPTTVPPSGSDPTTGLWGVKSCYTAPGSGAVMQLIEWRRNPAPSMTAAQIAQLALAKLHLLGAQIVVAPQPGGAGAVGLPVWLSTVMTAGTWGPQTASDTEGDITVTITAQASRIVWSMGDGGTVPCGNPGTPYDPKFGMAASPACGYVYAVPSSTPAHPHGRYTITATTFWTVTWTGDGQSGVLTPTSQAQTSVEIGEVQVVGQ
jgi:hypothetical protein